MDNFSVVFIIIWLALMLAFALRMGYKFYKSHFSKPVTVSAQVVSKHTVEFFSKAMPHQKTHRFVVNFLVKGKKKGFYVSGGLYHSLREGEKGTLTYQGDRVISFQ